MALLHRKKAQTIIEYIVTIGLIAVVVTSMGPYIKRGLQSIIKEAADQLRPQEEAEQQVDEESGYLERSQTVTRGKYETTVAETSTPTEGMRHYLFGDEITKETTTSSNLGLTEKR